MRKLSTFLLFTILAMPLALGQFWQQSNFSIDFQDHIKVRDSIYFEGFGTFSDTMRLFGTDPNGVGMDYDSLYLDNVGGLGIRLNLHNGRPLASGIAWLNLESDNSQAYLDLTTTGANRSFIRFKDGNSTPFTIGRDDDRLDITNGTSDGYITMDGALGIDIATAFSGAIYLGPQGSGGYDLAVEADTIHLATLDGTGRGLKLSATGEMTKGNYVYSMGPIPNDAVANGATEYVGLKGSSNFNNTADRFRYYMTHDGEFSELGIYMRTDQPATGSAVFTLYKNGSPTGIVVTIAASDPAGYYTEAVPTSVSFVDGDYFYIEAVNNASSSSGQFSGISINVTSYPE